MLSSQIPFVCSAQLIINAGLVSEKWRFSFSSKTYVKAAHVVEENGLKDLS